MAGVTTKTKLPQDEDSAIIQVLAPDETNVASFSLSAASQRALLPTGAEIVEVATTGNCKFAFGNSSLDITSGTRRLLVTGVYTYKIPSGATSFDASIVDGSSGRISVTRMI